MRVLFTLAAILLLAGCNEAVETTEQGGSNAVGIAETMAGGTIGETDMDSGDTAEEGAETEESADSGE